MPYLKLKDIDLYYEIHGDGEPLFLIPGLCGTCDSFSLILKSLAKRFKVITLDNRGAGRSLPTKNNFTIESLVEDLSELVNFLRIDRINLLGHSMGGFIAQEYAFKNSEKISKLILSNTAQKNSYRNKDLFKCLIKIRNQKDLTECWHRMFSQWIFTEDFINSNSKDYEAAIAYSMNYPYHQSPQCFEAQVEVCNEYDSSKQSRIADCRTLIICGEKDRLIFPDESISLKNSFPCSEIILMEKAGHIPMLENKKEYCKIITEFLLVI